MTISIGDAAEKFFNDLENHFECGAPAPRPGASCLTSLQRQLAAAGNRRGLHYSTVREEES